MSLKNFIYIADLGEGSYGQVIKARRSSDNQIYAIKKVRISPGNFNDIENTLNQIRILASIEHQNIITYKQAFYEQTNQSICIVMEFADGGDLQGKISNHQKKGTLFEEKEIWKVAEQLLKGLKLLQQYKIIHRDIKCANIFFSKGVAKLGDMNVSKVTQASLASTQTGTPYYASPEVWRNQIYSYKSDIWSLGCVLYEMCSSMPPFRAKNKEALNKKIQDGLYSRIPSIYSSRLSSFISLCLTVDVNKRADVDKLLRLLNCDSPKALLKIGGSSKKIILDQIGVPQQMEDLNKMLPKPKYKQFQSDSETNILDRFLRVQKSPLHNPQKIKQIRSQENLVLRSPRVQKSYQNQPTSLKLIPDCQQSHISHLIKKKEADIQNIKKKPTQQKIQKPQGAIKRQKLSLVNIHYGYIPNALK